MSDGVPLLGVYKGWEEHRVPDEEDGSVVPNQIPVAFLRIELHGEPTWVPAQSQQ